MKGLLIRGAIHAITLSIAQFMLFFALMMSGNYLMSLAMLIFNLITLSDAFKLLEASKRAED